jgi:hypothetical protein
MKLTNSRMLAILLTFSLLLAACSANGTQISPTTTQPLPGGGEPTIDSNAVSTSVAQTVEAELTQVSVSNPTNTLAPSSTNPPPPTDVPVEEGSPTATGVGPAPPSDGALTNQARFIEDVTIPDGTLVVAGNIFTKTWRIQNIGSESWTTDYYFVFINGDRMEGQALTLTQEIAPGGIIDISVPMIAPLEAGTYFGYWMLQSPDTEEGDDGPVFGIGANASQALYVQINVILPTPTPTATLTPTAIPEGSTPEPATHTPTPGPNVVNVSLGIEANSFVGACPATLNFTAIVTLSGPLTFNYRVNALASEGNYTFTGIPTDTVASTQAGPHTVTIPFSLSITQTVSGQISFEVTSPSNSISPPILFAVTCQ